MRRLGGCTRCGAYIHSLVGCKRTDAAGRVGGGPQRSPPQHEQGGRDCLEQRTNEYLKAPGREAQSGVRIDPQQTPQSMTQQPWDSHHQYAQARRNPGLHPTVSEAADGLMQSHCPEAQDVAEVVARNKEELERWSTDLLARLLALGLRNAGFSPREVVTALDTGARWRLV